MASAGNAVIHQYCGIYFEPSEIMVPKDGVGGCSPRPMKLRDAPSRMTQPTSSAILVSTGDRQLGSSSLNRMWNLLAPTSSAFLIKYSLL